MEELSKASKLTGTYTAKPINPLRSVLSHFPSVALIIVLFAGLGLIAVQMKVKPFYSAEAIIKIEPVVPKILYGKEEASIMPYYDDFVRTQITIVKNYSVLSEAIHQYQDQGLNWQMSGESMRQAVRRLSARLDIAQMRDTQLFSLSLTSRRGEGLAELINVVVDAYINITQEEQLNKDSSRLSFLIERKHDDENKLAEAHSGLENLSTRYAANLTDEHVYLQAIEDFNEHLTKATVRVIEAESNLLELQRKRDAIDELDISSELNEFVESDRSVLDNRTQISRLFDDFDFNLSLEHPESKKYEAKLKKLQENQAQLRSEAREKGSEIVRGIILSEYMKEIKAAETELIIAGTLAKDLREELTKAETKAADISEMMMRAETLKREILRLQGSLLRIDERIDQLEIESRSSGRISVMNRAQTPEYPSSGKRKKLSLIVILFSFAAGIGYALAIDRLDNKIHGPQDAIRVLGFPPSGFILDAADEKETINDLCRVVIDNPYSQMAEQYKDVAFSFYMEHERHKSKKFTCLSIDEGDGTSSFLFNTLSSLKEKSGKKIYVDLNIWNPISNKMFPDAEYGLWEVLDGTCIVKDAIITDSDYPFHILPLGNWQFHDKSLFQEFGLDSLIDALSQEYEYVMIDSPPISLTTDAKFLAKFADVVVLLASADKVAESSLFRVVSMLDRIEVNVISVVLNRVKFRRGGYFKKAMGRYYKLIDPSRKRLTTQISTPKP